MSFDPRALDTIGHALFSRFRPLILRAGPSETFREGEPPCEPSADAGSVGASTSQLRRRGTHRAKHKDRSA
jgi:hypothetical protein